MSNDDIDKLKLNTDEFDKLKKKKKMKKIKEKIFRRRS